MTRTLRILFLLLALANILIFAWAHGYFGQGEEGREPQRIAEQIAPEKLSMTDTVPVVAPPPPPVKSCRRVDGLTLADAKELQAQAKDSAEMAGLELSIKPVEPPPGHWVFLPPQPNRAAAEKKLGELKRRGVAGFLVLDDGVDKLAISLGMFDREKEAEDYLHTLTGKGVKSAVMQLRRRPAEKAQLEVRGTEELLRERLPELLGGIDTPVVTGCAGT